MTKRTILSLPEEALKQADQLASELHVSRAEFIRRAVGAYAEELKKKKEEEEIRRQREEACRGIDEIREKYGVFNESGIDSTKVIREWREKDRLARMYERHEAEAAEAREKKAGE
jgi:hypothetical protein